MTNVGQAGRLTSNDGVDRLPWAAIGLLTLLALALRIAAARGALWLDEAWSAQFAHEVRTPGAVFFAINHDNNHYLNTLWLQLVGWGAPPILARALSIACGTASVIVAGLIGARRGRTQAIILAALFAISPILLTYGAEARGYAPMLLALLIGIWLVDRDVAGRPLPGAARALGYAGAFGMLAHLAMLPGLLALAAWALAARLSRREKLPQAIGGSLRLMRGALLAAMGVVGVMVLAAHASPDGYRIGSYQAFSLEALHSGLETMIAASFGLGFLPGALLLAIAAIALPLVAWRLPVIRDRALFLALLLYALPGAALLLQLGNSGIPRYYLIVALGLLLLMGEVLAAGWTSGGARRVATVAAIALIAVGSAVQDSRIIANRRANPGGAITAMAARMPHGSEVMISSSRDSAVLAAAAASASYSLHIIPEGCPPTRFLFGEQDDAAAFPDHPIRCGHAYRKIMSARADGLSGVNWQLYERE